MPGTITVCCSSVAKASGAQRVHARGACLHGRGFHPLLSGRAQGGGSPIFGQQLQHRCVVKLGVDDPFQVRADDKCRPRFGFEVALPSLFRSSLMPQAMVSSVACGLCDFHLAQGVGHGEGQPRR